MFLNIFFYQKLAKQQRSNFSGDGGPPPFVPFGQKIASDGFKPSKRGNCYAKTLTLNGTLFELS